MNEEKLNKLITNYGNAMFDCGEYEFEHGEDPKTGPYVGLSLNVQNAKLELINFVKKQIEEKLNC